MKALLIPIILLLSVLTSAESIAQLKNLDKRIGDKISRKIDRKADRTIDKALDKGEKEIDNEVNEAVKGEKKENTKDNNEKISEVNENSSPVEEIENEVENKEDSFVAYSKFDFIPGEKIIFYDDFTVDNAGDFPAKWNTNGSGEVVTTAEGEKWFELKGNSIYVPLMDKSLPENYTVEFDLKSSELDNKLSSQSYLEIKLDDNEFFNPGKQWVRVKLPFYQFTAGDIRVENRINGQKIIDNGLTEDIRSNMRAGAHISIAVNKKRFRLWVDEQKVIDIPTLVPENAQRIKFTMLGFNEDFKNYQFYMGNLKIAEGTTDLRSKLITEGRFATNGILFDVNSDRIKPESHGVLKEIAKVLKDNSGIKVRIIGHTDADGDDKNNLELSKRRAASVRSTLVNDFEIDDSRLETDGKGESEPADTSNTPEGKANNRRVEFVKI